MSDTIIYNRRTSTLDQNMLMTGRTTPPSVGVHSFYHALKGKIDEEFCSHVKPQTLFDALCHENVFLTDKEKDELQAKERQKGMYSANMFLLDCLSKKDKWFDGLLRALRRVHLGFLADGFQDKKRYLINTHDLSSSDDASAGSFNNQAFPQTHRKIIDWDVPDGNGKDEKSGNTETTNRHVNNSSREQNRRQQQHPIQISQSFHGHGDVRVKSKSHQSTEAKHTNVEKQGFPKLVKAVAPARNSLSDPYDMGGYLTPQLRMGVTPTQEEVYETIYEPISEDGSVQEDSSSLYEKPIKYLYSEPTHEYLQFELYDDAMTPQIVDEDHTSKDIRYKSEIQAKENPLQKPETAAASPPPTDRPGRSASQREEPKIIKSAVQHGSSTYDNRVPRNTKCDKKTSKSYSVTKEMTVNKDTERRSSGKYNPEKDFNEDEVDNELGSMPGYHKGILESEVEERMTKSKDGTYILWYFKERRRPAITVIYCGKLKTFLLKKRKSHTGTMFHIFQEHKEAFSLKELLDYHLLSGIRYKQRQIVPLQTPYI